MLLRAATLLLLACLPALDATATTTLYSTRAEWAAAVGSFVTEDFESVPLQQVSQAGGTIATTWFDIVVPANHGDIGISGAADHSFEGDVHYCDVPPGVICEGGFVGEPEYNNLVFHAPISAFALDLLFISDELPEEVETLEFHLLGQVFSLAAGEFLGIVSDAPFSLVQIRGPTSQYYRIDNVSSDSASVPEPATALLFASGVATLALSRRRRSRAIR